MSTSTDRRCAAFAVGQWLSAFGRVRALALPVLSIRLRRIGAATLMLILATLPLTGRADTVASLLGDFTINQFCGLRLDNDTVKVHFAIVFGQLPALRELHQADANGDGVTTQQERDAYVSTLAPGIAEKLALSVDGVVVPLRASSWTSSLPKEQSGFSMRIDIDYSGALPVVTAGNAVRTLTFSNKNFSGRIGWHEIEVKAPPDVHVFGTNAFSSSLTGGLNDALQSLPPSGPLDERTVHMSFTRGDVPAGSRLLQARDVATPVVGEAAAPSTGGTESAWLAVQTRRLIALISAPNVPIHVTVFALLAAMLLGALHALSPGHGKSIVGAYLVGSRGTPRHAVFLGLTVTVTHTLVVFALGLATLFASKFIVPERVFPVLSLLSGLLVLGMGLVLLVQRLKAARVSWLWGAFGANSEFEGRVGLTPAPAGVASHSHHVPGTLHSHPYASTHAHALPHMHSHEGSAHVHGHGPSEDGGHDHDHVASHPHDPGTSAMHSHGGSLHSHLPPGADGQAVSWRGLLALGVSGGLLPCPSAMVLLLAAVALNKTLFGLLLVVAFSVGLAMTLIAVGLAFLYARNRFQGRLQSARWPHLLPILSAASVTLLGAMLCIGTLISNPL